MLVKWIDKSIMLNLSMMLLCIVRLEAQRGHEDKSVQEAYSTSGIHTLSSPWKPLVS